MANLSLSVATCLSSLTHFWDLFFVLGGGLKGYSWVDAICVHQSDDKEKSHQIQMMGQIYQGALRTLLWLGLGAGDDLAAIDEMAHYEESDVPLPALNWSTLKLESPFKGSFRIIQNPYWSRLWITQELILSTKIEVCAGHHQ